MTILKRTTIAVALLASTIPGIAFAGEAALVAGKPAGVQDARITGRTFVVAGLGAAVIGGIVVLAGSSNKSPDAPYVTTGTP